MQSDDNLGPLVFKHRDIQAHSQEGTRGHYCAPIWKCNIYNTSFLPMNSGVARHSSAEAVGHMSQAIIEHNL